MTSIKHAHIVTHSFTKQPDSRNYASTNPPHGSTQYVMIFGQATLYLSAGHTMVWALPFSWYVPGWMPVPQGLHPSTYEKEKPDHGINGRAHTDEAQELRRIYVSALADLDTRSTIETGWDSNLRTHRDHEEFVWRRVDTLERRRL